jgi:hypothetical protein
LSDQRSAWDASLGFTVKSGWASVVLLAGSTGSVRVVESGRVDLSDPAIPASKQPYHAGFGTARKDGPELARLLASVEQYGRGSMTRLLDRHQQSGYHLLGAGVVVGSTTDPGTIANDHIRIHALEGRLFRQVVEDGVGRLHLPCSTWRERDLYGRAAATLDRPEAALRAVLTSLGRDVAGPWRAEQKAATLAAWLVLAAVAP